MRFNEFLTEDFATEQIIMNQVKTIRQNCQPYLTQNRDAINRFPLYRGVKKTNEAKVIRKEVRLDDRKPKDMPLKLHQFINGYFKKHYGAAFRNAMFVTSSVGNASEYGDVYLIFPAGNLQYLWSADYEDLYSITGEFGFESMHGDWNNERWQDAQELLVDQVLSTYQTDGLEKAIDSSHEIMIRCPYYYGIHSDVMYNKPLREQIIDGLYR